VDATTPRNSSLFRLDGRVAVVTGACGKLGPVWARALLDAGARVAGIDLDSAAPPPPLDDLRNLAAGAFQLHAADITDRRALERAREAIAAGLGPPSILVNNAGLDQPPSAAARNVALEEIPFAAGQKVLDVNVLGLFLATQVFLPSFRQAGGGSIINIGSLYGAVSPDARLYAHLAGDPPFLKPPMYGASKAAVSSLTRWLATHLAADRVRVNTLVPGGVRGGQDAVFRRKFTERVPLGRMAEYEDLIGPLVFLASDASSYVTGHDLLVDGGFTAW
jgi:NAD(P)-dependent dehydrogenase (short-subunit alcohol dehydrogenase family)